MSNFLSLAEGLGDALRNAVMKLFSQQARLIEIETALPSDSLVVERFVGGETVSKPFNFEIDCLSTSAQLELKTLVGEQVTLRLLQADGSKRAWHGYVTRAASLGADGGVGRYRLTISPWFSFLGLRRNSLIFQDKDVRDILTQLFADYPQAKFSFDVSQPLRKRAICTQYRETDLEFVERLLAEEGLSYVFEHNQAASASSDDGHAQHSMRIFDKDADIPAAASRSIRFHRAAATESEDAITRFTARRAAASSISTVAAWNASQIISPGSVAQADPGALPALEVYDADRAGVFPDADTADQIAGLRLAALQLASRVSDGSGSVRSLAPVTKFTLTEYDGFSGGSDFAVLGVEHHAANNLGSDIAALLSTTDMEAGSYRNHFRCVPLGTAIVPRFVRKPTAPGMQSALVVGVSGEAVTSNRDHQVRVQFHWQRGAAPNPGGLTDTASATTPNGHSPGDETSGTWVRISESFAGPNWGAHFVPRIGTEVLIGFLHGDIDQPVIVGSLYTGEDTPPFAAGEDSGANHPGVLSGILTQSLDGADTGRYVTDDAPGQLRTQLHSTQAESQLNLGYVIDQDGASRGGFRGEGFELATEAWSVVRAPRGLLVSTTSRSSAASTQMDPQAAIGQLNAAQSRAKALSDASSQQQASALAANQQQTDFIKALDPQQDGQYGGPVNGQSSMKPQDGSRDPGSDAVEQFSIPAVLLDSPSAIAWVTPGSLAGFSGQSLHLTTQQDAHLAAGATVSSVSGLATSLFAYDGGVKAVAANGPVSIQAHGDALQVLADQSVTVTSTSDSIQILASTKIVLMAGQSSITLDGQDITFAMPGQFTVKSGSKAFVAAGSDAAELTALPSGAAAVPPDTLELHYRYDDLSPVVGAPYKVTFADGSVLTGVLDAQGYKLLPSIPKGPYTVEYGEDTRDWTAPPREADKAKFTESAVQADGRTQLEAMQQREPVST